MTAGDLLATASNCLDDAAVALAQGCLKAFAELCSAAEEDISEATTLVGSDLYWQVRDAAELADDAGRAAEEDRLDLAAANLRGARQAVAALIDAVAGSCHCPICDDD